jgi:hypothetical protein
LTSTGGQPPFKPDEILYRCFCPFPIPFQSFQPTASQPYFHSFCILNFLYILFLSFGLSAFVYVCCSVLWFIFSLSARSLFLSLSLSLSSFLLPSLSRPGLRSFQDAGSRPGRQILNWARDHQKAPLAQWLERWSYEP